MRRTLIVGDVHGCARELDDLLDAVRELGKALKLKQLVIDGFVPPAELERVRVTQAAPQARPAAEAPRGDRPRLPRPAHRALRQRRAGAGFRGRGELAGRRHAGGAVI